MKTKEREYRAVEGRFQKRLKLKGLCVDELKEDSDFDTEFYAYGLFNDRLHFRY